MIVDGHCHIWQHWPYQPRVPDPRSRGGVEQLLYELDANDVERALVICARIGDNPGNVDYALEASVRYSGRLTIFPDLECRWSPDYGQPGARARLEQALARWDFAGFTLYLDEADDGSWLAGDEGRALFGLAAERRLIVSFSIVPQQLPPVVALAEAYPGLPILLHHFAFAAAHNRPQEEDMSLLAVAADCPNLFVKYSGIGNIAPPDAEFPYAGLQPMLDRICRLFGPRRMIWGSDYPVSRRHVTYRQAMSHLTRHGPFEGSDLDLVLGGNLLGLLAAGGMPVEGKS